MTDEEYAARLRADPTLQPWIDAAKESIRDGSFARDVAAQPDPQAFAEEIKARRKAESRWRSGGEQ